MNKTCSLCDRKIIARRLCNKHWKQWRSKINQLPPIQKLQPEEELKLLLDSCIITASCCMEWQRSKSPKGYGSINRKGVSSAHRYIWILKHGTIPNKLHVLHKCDNPPCVNPDHLFLGTNIDNVADRVRKNRGRHGNVPPPVMRGENHPRAKFNWKLVEEVRLKHILGQSMRSLAKEYCFGFSSMQRVLTGKTWVR